MKARTAAGDNSADYVRRQIELVRGDRSRRVIVIGGPQRGKSALARLYRANRLPTYCCDPQSLVKHPEHGVTYLPEGLGWSEASQYVADQWFTMTGSWCIEGVAAVRALRKWVRRSPPAEKIIVLRDPHPLAPPLLRGQRTMAKSVATIWRSIERRFSGLVEYR